MICCPLLQQRQKGTQFNPASVGQPLAGMQTMGMMGQMGTLGINQIRANGPLSYTQNQRFAQMRPQQQISNQTVLTSPQVFTQYMLIVFFFILDI